MDERVCRILSWGVSREVARCTEDPPCEVALPGRTQDCVPELTDREEQYAGRTRWWYDVLPPFAMGGRQVPTGAVPRLEQQAWRRGHAL
jgi:hypothetical protein